MIYKAPDKWARRNGVRLIFIEPERLTQNAVVESFNEWFRDECRIENWLFDLEDARQMIEAKRIVEFPLSKQQTVRSDPSVVSFYLQPVVRIPPKSIPI